MVLKSRNSYEKVSFFDSFCIKAKYCHPERSRGTLHILPLPFQQLQKQSLRWALPNVTTLACTTWSWHALMPMATCYHHNTLVQLAGGSPKCYRICACDYLLYFLFFIEYLVASRCKSSIVFTLFLNNQESISTFLKNNFLPLL